MTSAKGERGDDDSEPRGILGARGAGGGAAARERGAQTGRDWGTVMSERAGRLHTAAATRSIFHPNCCSRSQPWPWRR